MIEVKIEGNTYTEEEFQRDLKRYFNTLFKSWVPCGLYGNCERCMFFNHGLCGESFVKAKPIENSFEIIETVYKWAQEHPYRTNEDYILETMGIELGLIRSLGTPKKPGIKSIKYMKLTGLISSRKNLRTVLMMKIDSERLVGLINDDIKKIEHKLGDGSSSAYFYLNLSNPELMSYNKGALKEAYYIIGLIEALEEEKND